MHIQDHHFNLHSYSEFFPTPIKLQFSPSTTGRKRYFLTETQTERLLDYYRTDPYPSRKVKESLSKELNVWFEKIDKWFHDKRRQMKYKGMKFCNDLFKQVAVASQLALMTLHFEAYNKP